MQEAMPVFFDQQPDGTVVTMLTICLSIKQTPKTNCISAGRESNGKQSWQMFLMSDYNSLFVTVPCLPTKAKQRGKMS